MFPTRWFMVLLLASFCSVKCHPANQTVVTDTDRRIVPKKDAGYIIGENGHKYVFFKHKADLTDGRDTCHAWVKLDGFAAKHHYDINWFFDVVNVTDEGTVNIWWMCSTYEKCCEYECCERHFALLKFLLVLLVALLLIFVLMCYFVSRQKVFRRRAAKRQSEPQKTVIGAMTLPSETHKPTPSYHKKRHTETKDGTTSPTPPDDSSYY